MLLAARDLKKHTHKSVASYCKLQVADLELSHF